MHNLFNALPETLDEELFEILLEQGSLRIERIVSTGHSSPATGWYDQSQNEWVLLLKGEAILSFDGMPERHLKPGDYINLPAHTRHRVKWTTPDEPTLWLAVHY